MTTEELEIGVARLERQRRWHVVALALAVAGVAVAMPGDEGAIRASAFELVDDAGRMRGALHFEDGQPLLVLNDEDGRARLQAYHGPEATGIYVLDGEGTPRIGIAQFAHGGGGVALHGPESKGAAVLYLKGSGSLRFFDIDGGVTLTLPEPGATLAEPPGDQ